ncbi:MAG TPA: pirin family protein, partial [Candidatus Binataceae bacterium]|nr:pirin family protein [Candidatus Binataceae bacterium]
EVRRAADRGLTQLDWLKSRHTFSFGDYFDPKHNGFSVLRVINDDWVSPGRGFATHSHADMEIVTYVLEGAVEHRDSLGTRSVIPAGDVQRMTAGTGITHSEFNPSQSAPLHFLQIWILPERRGLTPGYQQKSLGQTLPGQLALVASHAGGNGALIVHQDVDLYAGRVGPSDSIVHRLRPERRAYAHVALGKVALNGVALAEGDGAQLAGEARVEFANGSGAEVLLFDLP